MISEFEDFVRLFQEIDLELKNEINVYVIGGAMLLYHKLKIATKDIDIIVSTRKEYDELHGIFTRLGFKTKIPTVEYSKLELSQMFIRNEFRVDLFQKRVCNGFSLSDAMKERGMEVKTLKYFKLFLCAKEDVFVFKTFTERDGDIEDCIKIIKEGIDWDIILNELISQTKAHAVWITYTAGRLELLEEKGLSIPIMNKVTKLVENYYTDLEKRTNQ